MQRPVLITFSILFFAAGAILTAQSHPNFSGEWKMDIAKSDFGRIPAPEALTRDIQETDSSLHIKTYSKGRQGEVRSELEYTLDGKECINHLEGGDAKGTVKWDGASLMIESTRDYKGTEIRSREVWSLSDGGKVLTIQNHVTIAQQGDFDTKLVMNRQ